MAVGRAVNQFASVTLLRYQPRVHQFLEVERQRGGRNVEPFGDGARGQSRRPGYHQHSEHLKAQAVRKRGKASDSIIFFHISNIVEL